MIASFFDFSVFHHYNLISGADSAQTVCDDNDCLFTRTDQVIKGLLDLVL